MADRPGGRCFDSLPGALTRNLQGRSGWRAGKPRHATKFAPRAPRPGRPSRRCLGGLSYVIASFTERHGFPAPPCRRFQPPMVHAPVGTLPLAPLSRSASLDACYACLPHLAGRLILMGIAALAAA